MNLLDQIDGDIEMHALDAYTFAIEWGCYAYSYASFAQPFDWEKDEQARSDIEAAAQRWKAYARVQLIKEYAAFIRNTIKQREETEHGR